MVVIGGDVPGALACTALIVQTCHAHHHAPQRRAQRIKHLGTRVEQPGQRGRIRQHPMLTQPRQKRECALRQPNLQGSAKQHAVLHLVVRREQLQIRDVTHGTQPWLDPLKRHTLRAAPAHICLPLPATPHLQSDAAVAQYRLQCGHTAGCGLCWGNAYINTVNALPSVAQKVHHSRRQRGYGAGAGDRHPVARCKRRLHCRCKIAHKAATIRQINIVRAGLCTRAGYRIVLALKRTGGVDQQLDLMLAQCLYKMQALAVHHRSADTRAVALIEFGRQSRGAPTITSCHQQRHGVVSRQRAADARTKVSVPSQHHHSHAGIPINPKSRG